MSNSGKYKIISTPILYKNGEKICIFRTTREEKNNDIKDINQTIKEVEIGSINQPINENV